MADVVGGFGLEDFEVAEEQRHHAVVAGEEVEEELCFEEGV